MLNLQACNVSLFFKILLQILIFLPLNDKFSSFWRKKVCDTVVKGKYLENITDRNLHRSGSGQFTITAFGTCLGLVTALSGLTFFLEDRAWSELTYFFRTKLGLISFRCQIFSLGFDQSRMILAWPGPFQNHINLVPPKNLCKKCRIGILTLL